MIVDPVSEMAIRMIHIPGWMVWNGSRFHHATQDSTQFKTYELFLEFSI